MASKANQGSKLTSTGRRARTRPTLVRFDPYARNAMKLASQDLCSTWAFFESPECVSISDDISGKIAPNPVHRVDFFYLGRPTNTAKPTVVKFSFYQGAKIAHFLGEICDQFAEMQERTREDGLDEIPIIPFLRGKEHRNYSAKDESRLLYWDQDADLDLGNVRLSVLLNTTLGLPEVMINCPVPIETSNKLKGWPGPCLTLSMNACANLEAFVMENRKENIDSFIEARPKKGNGIGTYGAETLSNSGNALL